MSWAHLAYDSYWLDVCMCAEPLIMQLRHKAMEATAPPRGRSASRQDTKRGQPAGSPCMALRAGKRRHKATAAEVRLLLKFIEKI